MSALPVLATLSDAAGFPLGITPADAPSSIQFLAENRLPDRFPIPAGEVYVIRIVAECANVNAATPAGYFNGLQTLARLIRNAGRDAGVATAISPALHRSFT